MLFFVFCFLVELQEEACQNGSADAVPGTRNGARQDGQRLGSKEVTRQDRCQSGILHTHLDTDGALLGLIEAGSLAS